MKLDNILKDYAREQVPQDKLVPWWHIALVYIGVLTLIPCMISALITGNPDIIQITIGFGWSLWALILIIFASWGSNDNNLYSASLGLASILEKFLKWKITIIAGIIGGLLGIIDQFIPFLIWLGTTIPALDAYLISILIYTILNMNHLINKGSAK